MCVKTQCWSHESDKVEIVSCVRRKADVSVEANVDGCRHPGYGQATSRNVIPPLKIHELIKKLATAASEARLNAYAPYSKFQVGAALLCDNEEIVKGM
ncbi:unnamed protein product, partial [Notodromas monacha]